jgi:hypothetical protein
MFKKPIYYLIFHNLGWSGAYRASGYFGA